MPTRTPEPGTPPPTPPAATAPAANPEAADPSAQARTTAAALAECTGAQAHDVAVVLGSGWQDAVVALGQPDADVPMSQVPGLCPPTAAGHAGRVVSVRIGRSRALVFAGRVHGYEGHEAATVARGVRAACAAGAHTVILTNAAGGLRADLTVGGPVLIADHLNLTGRSPLVGPRFVDMVDAYSPRLRSLAREVSPDLPEGVYAGLPGPQYETPAEIRMLRTLGADLVGMSTVHETIAARAEGAEVLGISLVTNLAAGITGEPLDHAEVLAAGAAAAAGLGTLIRRIVERL